MSNQAATNASNLQSSLHIQNSQEGSSFCDINHSSDVVNSISRLYGSETFSDVTLVVKNMRFPAHRVILATRSEYFRALFYGGLAESSSSMVFLNDINVTAFKHIMRYIYTGKLKITKTKLALSILGLAHQYNFCSLENSLSNYLTHSLRLKNIWLIYNLAIMYNLESLMDACLKFLDSLAPEPLHDSRFLRLSQSAVEHLLSRDSFCASEIEIFRAVCAWLRHTEANESKQTNSQCDLLNQPDCELTKNQNSNKDKLDIEDRRNNMIRCCVRFDLMSLTELLNEVRSSKLVSSEDLLDAINRQTNCPNELPHRAWLLLGVNLASPRFGCTLISGECGSYPYFFVDDPNEFCEIDEYKFVPATIPHSHNLNPNMQQQQHQLHRTDIDDDDNDDDDDDDDIDEDEDEDEEEEERREKRIENEDEANIRDENLSHSEINDLRTGIINTVINNTGPNNSNNNNNYYSSAKLSASQSHFLRPFTSQSSNLTRNMTNNHLSTIGIVGSSQSTSTTTPPPPPPTTTTTTTNFDYSINLQNNLSDNENHSQSNYPPPPHHHHQQHNFNNRNPNSLTNRSTVMRWIRPVLKRPVISGHKPPLPRSEHDVVKHSLDDPNGCIIIKLGRPSIINTIRMQLWDSEARSYSYTIEVSLDQTNWQNVADYRNYLCRSWQTIHFPARVLRFIRITGTRNTCNRTFHLVTFRCLYSDSTFKQIDGFLIPTYNVATVDNGATVLEGVSRNRNALIDDNVRMYDWNSGYTCHQLGNGAIVIQLAQPFLIRSIRFLLWDLDSRTYSYSVYVSNDLIDWKLVWDATHEQCRSWQIIHFPLQLITFIRVVGSYNSANEVFHLVHLECPYPPGELDESVESDTGTENLNPLPLTTNSGNSFINQSEIEDHGSLGQASTRAIGFTNISSTNLDQSRLSNSHQLPNHSPTRSNYSNSHPLYQHRENNENDLFDQSNSIHRQNNHSDNSTS